LADPYDTDELTDKIYKTISDAEFREALSAKALRRAYNFSWKKTVIETIKVYEEVYDRR